MMRLIVKYNIPIILLSLVLGIAYLSYYNYKTQQNLLLIQMKNNSLNVISSVSAAVERFDDIKSTMSLDKLLNDVSLGLEIFEFRYMRPDGTIRNSMFKNEIGKIRDTKSFVKTMQGDQKMKEFFFEVRDYVDVMAIYYPIYENNDLIGIIDLSVDVSEYKVLNGSEQNFSVLRRKVDIFNLLKSIEGSISNSLAVYRETNMHNFLLSYVNSTRNIMQISLVDSNKSVYISSDKNMVGKKIDIDDFSPPSLINVDGHLTYRTIVQNDIYKNDEGLKLMFLIDASTYGNHEKQLLQTAVVTSVIALFFALFTSISIYYATVERSRKEKERLELLVRERTHEIELLSKTDSLTGLWNRRYLEEMLELEFERARRSNFDFSIMVIDLDYFKRINDSYGHMAGDEVLREISSRISKSIRKTDFVARYGGEEIVVILPQTNIKIAQEIANKILKVVSEKAVEFESLSIDITTSIGISSLRDEHNGHQMIFAEADEALYSAKENGRNRMEVFNVSTQD